MYQFILKRILFLVPVLFIVSVLTFSLSFLGAGDAARILAEKEYVRPTIANIELTRVKYGLDKPAVEQYFHWLKKVCTGDFGNSYKTNKPVLKEFVHYFPNTLKLSFEALLIVIVIAIPFGMLSALKPGGVIDTVGKIITFFSVSMPSFWVGLMLLYILGAKLKVIQILGGDGMFIAAFTMAFGMLGMNIRLMKEGMSSVLDKGYMKAAKAKGISSLNLYGKHALKNAILPVVTKFGMIFGGFLSGASIIESIFSITGIGKYALEAVVSKDVPVIQCYVMVMAAIVVLVNLAVDILYSFLDPRIRLS
ncbi:ABC transporter permease [Sinanaerobacter sp. ZZT-01]|uniref:ABC transporter permease n=1 Tax=Sinanaerobacter sp. ZZT-01 TaxID=3111540 RepID=UPI002D78995F|nr:ABC transporter permease [Sinanaerobacter sp. ZZT-01]WRR93025.1 ABC transporter permease [Sinanaerobacter sp. ZZT-01]